MWFYLRSRETTILKMMLSSVTQMSLECAEVEAQKWIIFNLHITLSSDNVDKFMQAACYRHIYLKEDKKIDQIDAELNPKQEQYLDENSVVCICMP